MMHRTLDQKEMSGICISFLEFFARAGGMKINAGVRGSLSHLIFLVATENGSTSCSLISDEIMLSLSALEYNMVLVTPSNQVIDVFVLCIRAIHTVEPMVLSRVSFPFTQRSRETPPRAEDL